MFAFNVQRFVFRAPNLVSFSVQMFVFRPPNLVGFSVQIIVLRGPNLLRFSGDGETPTFVRYERVAGVDSIPNGAWPRTFVFAPVKHDGTLGANKVLAK